MSDQTLVNWYESNKYPTFEVFAQHLVNEGKYHIDATIATHDTFGRVIRVLFILTNLKTYIYGRNDADLQGSSKNTA